MERQKREGIILGKRRGKEKDQVLVVFSKQAGKQFILAKGANAITSRRVGILDSLNLIRFDTMEHGGYAYLRSVDLVSRLQNIKELPQNRATLLLCMDVLHRLLPLEEPEENLYGLVQKFIRTLARSKNPQQDARQFLLRALTILGYHTDELMSLVTIIELVEEITQRSMRRAWKFLDTYDA